MTSETKRARKMRAQAERTGFEPADPVSRITGLANRRFRPLSHLSGSDFFESDDFATQELGTTVFSP